MKIVLDENLPDALVPVLRDMGHEVDSVNTLRLKGIANSALYRDVAQQYDFCFTKDAGFARSVRALSVPSHVKVLRVTLSQRASKEFVSEFVTAFKASVWQRYGNGSDWP